MDTTTRSLPSLPSAGPQGPRITAVKVLVAASLFLAIAVGATILQFSRAEDYVLPLGSVIGGDYVAFFAAAEAIARGLTVEIYSPEIFQNLLLEVGPPQDAYTLTWQYPPSYYFLVSPLTLTGYLPGYILWTGLGALAFLLALRGTGTSWAALYIVIASPSVFHAAITGQNGFLTAALIAVAALHPDRRPVLAGLAAALLTVKPHLGLLLPLAYLAGGMWRAFFVAALGAVALFAASILVFGLDSWMAFHGGASGTWENIELKLLQIHKMATPMTAAIFMGLPAKAALAIHLGIAAATAGCVTLIWRRVADSGLRAAALCAGVLLVTPFAYFYELVILALPVLIVVKRGLERGWLKYEKLTIGLAYAIPMMLPGEPRTAGISWAFLTVAIVAAAVLRRVYHDCPGALPRLFRHGPG